MSAIDMMVESLKRIMLDNSNERLIAILSPTDKWGTKIEYTKLRKFLMKDGYICIASEVFMRIVQNRKVSEKHYQRIDEVKPKTGAVRLLRLTEKQYNNIYMVAGEPDYQEKTVGVDCYMRPFQLEWKNDCNYTNRCRYSRM